MSIKELAVVTGLSSIAWITSPVIIKPSAVSLVLRNPANSAGEFGQPLSSGCRDAGWVSFEGDAQVVLDKSNTLFAISLIHINLSKALARNRHIFGEDKWNTIGVQNATAVHFCSIVLNHEVFNISMDWSILCPFKVVAYTMKAKPEEVTTLLTRPTYLLEKDPHPQGRDVGKSIENRIIEAITEAL